MQTKHLYKQKNLKNFETITTAIVGVYRIGEDLLQWHAIYGHNICKHIKNVYFCKKDWESGELNEEQTVYQIWFSNGSAYSQELWYVRSVKNVFQSQRPGGKRKI